ncbi:MAG: polysaccharide biosynthesis/export family protein [Pseudomonadota bacterium]
MASDPYAVPEYRLAVDDEVRVVVFGEPTLSKNYTVTSSGDIAFPLIGDVKAAGMTATELNGFLTETLGNGFLNNPRLNVEILKFRPFYVLGEVSRSGEFKYRPELTVLQAIALAGGYTYRADRKRVFIRRAGQETEFTYELDKGRAIYISPGDTIRIGERFF